MKLYVPRLQEWAFRHITHDERPAAAIGITITPAEDAKGSWAEYVDGAVITQDIYGIEINFNSNSRSGAIGNTLVDIGIDPAAGTSYVSIINNLSACHASPYNVGQQGFWYYFPLFIPAGCSIAARASIDNSTVGSLRSFLRLYGKPKYQEFVKVGRRVETLGAVTATSEGTVVVAGGASEGTWTDIGTLAKDAWYFQIGICTSDASLTAGICDWDLAVGTATDKRIVGNPQARTTVTGTSEQFGMMNESMWNYVEAAAGEHVYVRGQHSGTPDSDVTAIVYAVGG